METGRVELEGKRALVVGGSGGIGAAVAEALAARGADLVIHGGSSAAALERALAAARAAREGKGRSKASIEGFLQVIARPRDIMDRLPSIGNLDILVCAFGPFLRAGLHETGGGDWERMALLDLALPGALASALLPSMCAGGYGRMLFFGGTRTDAIRAYSSNAAYAAAKTGLAVLVKSVAAEYADRNVGAFLLCPGFVDTELMSTALRIELESRAPRGHLIDARAVAAFGVELLAADPPLASGGVINLDGGLKLP